MSQQNDSTEAKRIEDVAPAMGAAITLNRRA